jgi:uncharacterized protein YeaC (DUF1315 family)
MAMIAIKSYGQINFEAEEEIFRRTTPANFLMKWGQAHQLVKEAAEAGAQAVIEEFCARHNIVITPEDD